MNLSRRKFLGAISALGLSSCARHIPLISPLVGEPDSFAVAAVSDLHINDARSTAIVNKAVDQINSSMGVRFTVAIGDLATDGHLPELNLARMSLERLQKPLLAVPGNHDIDPRSAEPYGNYRRNFGRPNWIHEEQHWTFIGLDTCEGTASDVTLRPERIEWLRKKLRQINGKRPIGLFGHHPFNPTTKAYRVKNADEVLALFSEHNLRFVASGHYHGNQEETANGVLFTTTACCSSTRQNFDKTDAKGFRLFVMDGESVSTEFVQVPA